VARGDAQRPFVHRVRELLGVDADAVVTLENDQLDLRLHRPLVGEGGKVELGAHDARALRIPDALGDDGQSGGRGRQERDLLLRRAPVPRHARAERLEAREPVLVPRRRTHPVPERQEIGQVALGPP